MAAANPAQPRDPAVVSRRTLARGAVWSVPVIAGVALAPTASAASTDDVVVAAYCVSGVTPANRRGFNVSAAAGVIPIGCTFTFTSSGALNNLTAGTNTVSAPTTNPTTGVVSYTITVTSPLAFQVQATIQAIANSDAIRDLRLVFNGVDRVTTNNSASLRVNVTNGSGATSQVCSNFGT